MEPPQRDLLKRTLQSLFMVFVFFLTINLFFAPSSKTPPDKAAPKTFTIKEVVIGEERIVFQPINFTPMYLQSTSTKLEFQPHQYFLQLRTLHIRIQNIGTELVELNPAFNFLGPRTYVKDVNTGEEWDLNVSNIIFQWLVNEKDALYQKYRKSKFPYPAVHFKIEESNDPRQTTFLRIECFPEKMDCVGPLMHHLKFIIPITVLEIIDPAAPQK